MRVSKQRYNTQQHTDENSIARALVQSPAKVGPMLTFLGGREKNKHPLLTLSEGVGNNITIEKSEYEYDVMERLSYTRNLVKTTTGTNVGQGGTIFYLTFEDRWFINQYVLISQSGVQMRIMGDPEPEGSNWRYPVRLTTPDPEAVVPQEDLVAGSSFGQMYATVGTDYSRGNASNWEAPSKVRHKLSTIRKSYSFSGRAKESVAEMKLPKKGGGMGTYWMDFEEWQYFLQWQQEREMLMWYGEQTYNEEGKTQLRDPDSGKPIIAGPGLLEQIQNKDTYSILTTSKLKNTVRNLFYGMSDKADNQQITLYTGTGGMEEFDKAMKDEVKSNSYIVLNEGKFISGSGDNLSLGAYFRTYRHIDGHTITVTKMPGFDSGPVAESSRRHPVTNLPLESYRMVFVDQSNYEGKPNVISVRRKNREMLKWYVAGSVVPPGFDESNSSRASDIDGAAVHMLSESGICLRRFNTSLDMQCVAQ